MVMIYGVPGQVPAVEVGVTMYCTVPEEVLPGFVSVWLMVLPDPAEAPVIPPEIEPIVHVNVLGVLAVSAKPGLVPLQVLAVDGVVTTGLGFTVTVIVNGEPAQFPVLEVGVTMYCTDPVTELLGLFNTWLMVLPLPALAPVTPPMMAPIVHEKLLGAEAVSVIFGVPPVHMAAAGAFVTAGVGSTVTVIV
jgi:hypothetical protein